MNSPHMQSGIEGIEHALFIQFEYRKNAQYTRRAAIEEAVGWAKK
jgi:hypothetical protein